MYKYEIEGTANIVDAGGTMFITIKLEHSKKFIKEEIENMIDGIIKDTHSEDFTSSYDKFNTFWSKTLKEQLIKQHGFEDRRFYYSYYK